VVETLATPRMKRFRLFVRRRLLGVARLWLRLRSRPGPPPAGPVTLIVSPHPDDEVLGCGGLIARRIQAGGRVCVLYVTDGSASHPGHPALPPAALAARRLGEALAALRALGADPGEAVFLDERDGTLDRLDPAAERTLVGRIAELLGRLRPAEVFLPCRADGSSEHEAVFRQVQAALRATGLAPRVYEFPVWAWWNPLRLPRPIWQARRIWRCDLAGLQALKARALAEHRSQVEPTPPWTDAPLSREFQLFFDSPEEYFFEH
jgi:LmbE family N-acetylglucosaminyl deacetylase